MGDVVSDIGDFISDTVEDLAPAAALATGLYFGAPLLFGEAAAGAGAAWGAGEAGSLASQWAALEGTPTLVMGGELAAGGAGAFSAAEGFAGWGGAGMDWGVTDPFATTAEVNAGWNPITGYGLGSGYGGGALDSLRNLGWGDVKNALSIASPLMSVGSGLYGMSQADALRKQAALAGRRADPWGTSGGRGVADAQLQELLRNPEQVATRDPSYALRMQGAQRANAIYGQDSGAMAVAGANASTDWYNQRLAQLGGLAGATQNPAAGEQFNMTGQIGANDLASRSLASIGYGVTRAGGGTGMELPPGFREQLRAAGYAV